MVNKPELIAVVLIALTLLLLLKYTPVKLWHMGVILVAGFFLAVYVPQIPGLVSGVAGWLNHAASLAHH
jgi:cell division protein FtsW (lipid II flippase)